ncbi:T9SS type B sorting domain-containing protein [Aestuariibaculum sediminum]|uniref:T9SS type B sorting domain-containing protein n=1 Tax=Aestuariibaculum sediminum TaxID=2770637 RepID=A0A8J6Q3L2_9FLAO|nr:T9SS type B sorting domain-containing protein [Aestuariibaculum sediminum]MBD0832450.1 T9SS type B sorting domain-containing protein [Aestuariibaculum sediminum]
MSVTLSYTQNESAIWYFGNRAGLDFKNGSPVFLNNGKLNTEEGCATISDQYGNLLFYTDGRTVFNKNHEIMPNGVGLKGHLSSTQSAIIVPSISNTQLYYIFTVDDKFGSQWGGPPKTGLAFSVVDMTLNSGLGDVIPTSKNTVLLPYASEKLTAVKKKNGDGFWIIAFAEKSNAFHAYEVNAQGVNTTPIVSPTNSIDFSRGYLKASPNGDKLAMINAVFNGFLLFDFDNVTGKISNQQAIESQLILTSPDPFYFWRGPYGLEFSPNGTLIYISGDLTGIVQFDISSDNVNTIKNTGILLHDGSNHRFAALQLALNKKIYVATYNSNKLGVIQEPNIKGTECRFIKDIILLDFGICLDGLPQFYQHYFSELEIEITNSCYGNPNAFNFSSNSSFDTIHWDFGDGTSSSEQTPEYTYSAPGRYAVSLTVTKGLKTLTQTAIALVHELPAFPTEIELQQCDNDNDGLTIFNLDQLMQTINPKFNGHIRFFESEKDAEQFTNSIDDSSAYKNKTNGLTQVWARVTNENECYKLTKLKLIVTTSQIPENFVWDFYACSQDDNMDYATFNFSGVTNEIKLLFPNPEDLIINYYRNVNDAYTQNNPIENISNYTNTGYPKSQQIYIRVQNKFNSNCVGLGAHINLHVNALPAFTLETLPVICSSTPSHEVVITPFKNLPVEDYNYTWAFNGSIVSTAPQLITSIPGNYSITLTKKSISNCSVTKTFTIKSSETATVSLNDITKIELSENNSIGIHKNNLGTGDYEFALNNSLGPYQDTAYFDKLPSGQHTLFINDKNGCGTTAIDVYIMGYPKFFTPNNDGVNDTWNIEGINGNNIQKPIVYIYDRYGKLLKEITPNETGWDGISNGKLMHPADYWFVVSAKNANGQLKTFKGHFSLIR